MSYPANRGAYAYAAFSGSNHEVELRKLSVVRFLKVEEERVVKQPVSRISAFIREKQLCRQKSPARALDLDMEVTCSAGIKRRYDGVEPPAPLGVGELMPAEAKTNAVVVTFLIRMPNLNKTAGERPAAIVEDEPGNGDPLTTGCAGIKIALER